MSIRITIMGAFILCLLQSLGLSAGISLDFGDKSSAIKIVGAGSTLKVVPSTLTIIDGTVLKCSGGKVNGNLSFINSNCVDSISETQPGDIIYLRGSDSFFGQAHQVNSGVIVSNANNRLGGITRLTGPICLQDTNATLTLALYNTLNQNIKMSNGTIVLENNLGFADDFKFTGSGLVDFNGFRVIFGGDSLSWGYPFFWKNANDLALNSQMTVTGIWYFSGNSRITGNGNIVDLTSGGSIWIKSGTTLSIADAKLKGLGSGRIVFEDDTSQLRFSQVEVEMDGNVTWTTGGVYVEGPTTIITKNKVLTLSNLASMTVDNLALEYDTLDFGNENSIQPIVSNDPNQKFIAYVNNGIIRKRVTARVLATHSNAMLRLTTNNSNALLACCKNNSNTMLRLNANNSNALIQLNANNSNAILAGSGTTLAQNTSQALLYLIKNQSNAMLFCCKNQSNALIRLNANNSNALLRLNANNSNAIMVLDRKERTDSNALLRLTKSLSNAMLFCCKNNSNALIRLNANNSNALLRLNANNSNAVVAGNVGLAKYTSHALLYLIENESNALLRLFSSTSNALLACCKNNSNALIRLNANNSNAILAGSGTTLAQNTSQALLYLIKNQSNALLITSRHNSNAIVWLKAQVNTIDHGPFNIVIDQAPVQTLGFDLFLSSSHVMQVTVDTTINGSGHTIKFSRKIFDQMIVLPGVKVVLENVVLQDFDDRAIKLMGVGSEVIFGNCTKIMLSDCTNATKNWTFVGDAVVYGDGNILDLVDQKISVLQPGHLMIQNSVLHHVRNNNIACVGPNAEISFKGSSLCLSHDYTFSVGSMRFINDNSISGTMSFMYTSSGYSTIHHNSSLLLDKGVSFHYAPSVENRDLLAMQDRTAQLFLNGCTLVSSVTGMRLTSGTLCVDHKNILRNTGATSVSQGFAFGNGTAGSDLDIQVFPGGSIELADGVLDYANVDV